MVGKKTDPSDESPKKDASRREAKAVEALIARAFDDEDPAACFAHFHTAAERVVEEGLEVWRGSTSVAAANIDAALAAVRPGLPAALARLADVDVTGLFELPALARAVGYAVQRVPTAVLSAGEIDALLDEGGVLRELTLTFLEVASHPRIGLLPPERVRAVREGTGKLDKAWDFVAIPGLFREFDAALAGKHPFLPEHMELLASHGARLVNAIKAADAPRPASVRGPEALTRDRYAALLVDRYDQLLEVGAVIFGVRRLADHVPPLLSRPRGATKDAPATPAPKPEPAPA